LIMVAAAGNTGPGSDTVTYPAKFNEVIAVSATNMADAIPSWGSRGTEVDVAAPGSDIYSTYKDAGYATLSGTSMAAPHVTGSIALRLQISPGLTPSQALSLLKQTAEPLAKKLGIQIETMDQLRETDHGIFSNQSGSPEQGLDRERIFQDHEYQFGETGESWNNLQARMEEMVTHILEKYKGKTVLIVTHGFPVRVLNEYLL